VSNRYLLFFKKFHNDSFIFCGVTKKNWEKNFTALKILPDFSFSLVQWQIDQEVSYRKTEVESTGTSTFLLSTGM